NEKEDIAQEELDSIALDIPKKAEAALSDLKTLEAEIKEEYLDLIILVETEDIAG
ncbi:hypothetical protein KI387_016649, partial [Taxus chinensis]